MVMVGKNYNFKVQDFKFQDNQPNFFLIKNYKNQIDKTNHLSINEFNITFYIFKKTN